MTTVPLCHWLPCKPTPVNGLCPICARPIEQCEQERARPLPIEAFLMRTISTSHVFHTGDGRIHMQKPKYYVLNDHTLGYVFPKQPQHFGVLAADLDGHNPMSGVLVLTLTDTLRVATLEDFHRFRVDPTGHLDGIRRAEPGDIFLTDKCTHCETTHD